MKNRRVGVVAVCIVLALVAIACRPIDRWHHGTAAPDRARYILPPGNYGGLPTTAELARPAAALRRRSRRCAATSPTPTSTATTCPRTSSRSARPTRSRPAGPGTTILYDAYGVPHITGKTRADLAFGAGWVTARDRGLLLQLGRGPARAAVADVPGINAFGLVTSGQSFVPSAATEQLVTDQVQLIIEDLRREGPGDHRRDAGRGRRHQRLLPGARHQPAAGDGERRDRGRPRSSARSSAPAAAPRRRTPSSSSTLQNHLGADTGHKAWDDAMLFDDPEAPTTLTQRFDYGPLTGGPVTGSVDDRRGLDRLARPDRPPPPRPQPRRRAAAAPPARRPPRRRPRPRTGDRVDSTTTATPPTSTTTASPTSTGAAGREQPTYPAAGRCRSSRRRTSSSWTRRRSADRQHRSR